MAVRVVVLGGSFGGLTAAFELKRLLGDRAEITVLSDEDKFVFLPSLIWVAMGQEAPERIILPLQRILPPKGIRFRHLAARGVDAQASVVETSEDKIPYDFLVIATGPYLHFAAVPGLGPEGGYTECICTLKQALRAREAWQQLLQSPGPIVVGSVQGASCFGPSYEMAFLMEQALRRQGLKSKAPIIYLSSEPYPGHMGIGGLRNSRRAFEDWFADREIKTLCNQAVQEITPQEVRLQDGTKLPYRYAMLPPAFQGVPAVAHLGNPKGFIPVDGLFRHLEHENIFSVGVAVAMAPPEPTPVPTGLPKTGYMTVRMAKTAAAAIAAQALGKSPPKEPVLDVICLMDMGRSAALMMARPVVPPRDKAAIIQGRWFKWLKHAFERYFMFKMRHGLTRLPY